jgi:hypothetical protein
MDKYNRYSKFRKEVYSAFVDKVATISASFLMRIRSNCCLYRGPCAYSGKGRPRKADARILRSPQNTNAHQAHGEQFKINDPSSHSKPNQSVEINDPKLGLIRVSRWQNLHFRNASSGRSSLALAQTPN